MTKDPILFVSHDASPTGAPFLLLHLLRWLRANTKLDIKVALNTTGTLEAEFAELAPTTVLRRPTVSASGRVVDRLVPYRARAVLDTVKLRRALGTDRFALVYSNTLVNGNLLRRLPDQRCPLISHVHELEYVIRRWTTPATLDYTLGRTSHFIAGSAAVARNLSNNHGIDSAQIDVVHEFIPSLTLDRARLTESSRQVRAQLGIPDGAVVVGGAGTVDWRKGYDLFILLALDILRGANQRDIHFVWVGGTAERKIPLQIAHDVQMLGLEKRIHFVGYRTNHHDYMAMFDMLCLTSREDPFPLVVLECAALGKPVICFEKSGGSPEFVEDDCGFVVPYLDIRAMAARVVELVDNGVLRDRLGRRGEVKVREHHDVTVVAPRIADIIERSIATRNLGR